MPSSLPMRRSASWTVLLHPVVVGRTRVAAQLRCDGGSLQRLPPRRDGGGWLLRNHASGYKTPMCNTEGGGTTRRASPPLRGCIMMLVNRTACRQWAACIGELVSYRLLHLQGFSWRSFMVSLNTWLSKNSVMLISSIIRSNSVRRGKAGLGETYEMRMHMALMFPTTEGHGGEALEAKDQKIRQFGSTSGLRHRLQSPHEDRITARTAHWFRSLFCSACCVLFRDLPEKSRLLPSLSGLQGKDKLISTCVLEVSAYVVFLAFLDSCSK